MDRMPVETPVLSRIMNYLSVADRREVALLNKRWYEASLDPVLLKDTVVSFPATAESKQIFTSLVRRRTPHLVLEDLDDTFQSQLATSSSEEYLTSHLVSLSLKGSNITEDAFLNLIIKCHSLEKLDLGSCNNLFMSGILLSKPKHMAAACDALQNLRELNLASIRHLTDATFSRIIAVSPNLSKLSLAGNRIVFSEDLAQNVSSECLTFKMVHQILRERAMKIDSLNLSRTSVNDVALMHVTMIPDMELKEIYFVNCRELSPRGLIKLFEKQISLTVLDLSQCMEVNDNVVATICNNLRELKQLTLKKCTNVSDKSISLLHKLTNLGSIDLTSCHQVTSEGLAGGLCKSSGTTKLCRLQVACCHFIKDAFFLEAFKTLVDLTHLDLASTNISNATIMLISKSMTKLRTLNLAWCRGITDSGILGLFDREQPQFHVHEYDDGQCRCTRQHHRSAIFNKPTKHWTPGEISKPEMEVHMKLESALNNVPVHFGNLTLLEDLDLTSCYRLTESSLELVLVDLKNLRRLCLAMCNKLTDQVLLVIAKNNRCLETLDISHNTNYSDKGLAEVAYGLRRLASLNISNCDRLTDETIGHLQKYSKSLKTLDVSFNSNITTKAVDKLEQSLNQLQGLRKRLINVTESGDTI